MLAQSQTTSTIFSDHRNDVPGQPNTMVMLSDPRNDVPAAINNADVQRPHKRCSSSPTYTIDDDTTFPEEVLPKCCGLIPKTLQRLYVAVATSPTALVECYSDSEGIFSGKSMHL